MALSFDDRLLGEKVDNYCSSSDEHDDSEDDKSFNTERAPLERPNTSLNSSRSAQTGPKGVIEDYNRFQELQAENRRQKELMVLQLAEKCTMTCRPYSEDAKAQEAEAELKALLELSEDDEEFLAAYRRKRMAELQAGLQSLPTFNRIFDLNASTFVTEIDNEASSVTVIILIYEEGVAACHSANECLKALCRAYPHIKFCRIQASSAFMSRNFSRNGVPAVLVYKNKELIGNLISINKELDDSFSPEEFETFLYE
ncbi:unnamed protein product [Schistocephalus solidus]|nr:unnamed protein product [Schistocephalus solidus]